MRFQFDRVSRSEDGEYYQVHFGGQDEHGPYLLLQASFDCDDEDDELRERLWSWRENPSTGSSLPRSGPQRTPIASQPTAAALFGQSIGYRSTVSPDDTPTVPSQLEGRVLNGGITVTTNGADARPSPGSATIPEADARPSPGSATILAASPRRTVCSSSIGRSRPGLSIGRWSIGHWSIGRRRRAI